MAVATFASTRCGSFLHSGSRFVRVGARAGQHFAALHSSTQVEQSTKGQEEANGRGNADDASLDTLLVSTQPQLVLDHFKARRMGEDSEEAVHRIGGISFSYFCTNMCRRVSYNSSTRRQYLIVGP